MANSEDSRCFPWRPSFENANKGYLSEIWSVKIASECVLSLTHGSRDRLNCSGLICLFSRF